MLLQLINIYFISTPFFFKIPKNKPDFIQPSEVAQNHKNEVKLLYNKGLSFCQEINSSSNSNNQTILNCQADIYNRIGQAYGNSAQYPQALDYFHKALSIYRQLGHSVDEGIMLNNMGIIYDWSGEYNQAIKLYKQALTIYQSVNNKREEGITLQNLAGIYRKRGQYNQALDLYQIALTIFKELNESLKIGTILSNIGLIYSDTGQYNQALAIFQKALLIHQKIQNQEGLGDTLNYIGLVYSRQDKPTEALSFYKQSLKIREKRGHPVDIARTLNNIGLSYNQIGQKYQAIEYLEQALAIFQKAGNRTWEAYTLDSLGDVYRDSQDYSKAFEFYHQSLAIRQDLGERPEEATTLSNIGLLMEKQNQVESAIVFYKQFVNVVEMIRQDIRSLSREQQESYTETIAGTYRRLADLLLSQGRILEAQQVLELLKIQEIRDYLDDQRAGGKLPGVTLLPKEEELLQRYDTLIAFAQKLENCEHTQCTELTQLRDERDILKQQYQQAIQTLETEIRNRRAREEDAFLDPDDLGKQARDILEAQPGTVLIYPLVLEDKLWLLWAVEGRVVSKREIDVGQQQLGEAVLKLRQLLQDRYSDIEQLQQVSQQLYDWLIAPVEAELQDAKHLVFSLDRVTRYIPMGVLFDGEQYLIEKYTLNTILSAELTDMGDRLPNGTENAPILALGVSDAMADFNSLPNVVSELDGIVREENNPEDRHGVYPGLQFLNGEFNFNALRDNLSGRKLLHIATHGKFVPGRREESYLLLGNGEKLPIPEIEILTDYMDDTHLVVLSACETALGEANQEGIEINGISYYFLNGGAKTVLASLWNVNDGSTSHLMQQFYSHLSQGNFTKAEALQKAQLQMLRGEVVGVDGEGDRGVIKLVPIEGSSGSASTGLSHPYYWAAFILIGNGL